MVLTALSLYLWQDNLQLAYLVRVERAQRQAHVVGATSVAVRVVEGNRECIRALETAARIREGQRWLSRKVVGDERGEED